MKFRCNRKISPKPDFFVRTPATIDADLKNGIKIKAARVNSFDAVLSFIFPFAALITSG